MRCVENRKTIWFQGVLVFAITAIVFFPVVRGEFLNWDDNVLFLENFHFRGFSVDHLKWMSTTFFYGHWQPVSWFSYALDYELWGMNPHGWHLANWLLHATNGVLVFFLCLQFVKHPASGSGCRAAGLAALFYALHPLRVEPVAWLATRGYLLSGTFCLLTVLFYLNAARRKRYPYAALFFFTLAALTKGICMMLPFVLLLLDWNPLRRIRSIRKAVVCGVEKIPFFMLSLLTGITAFFAKQTAGGMADVERYGLGERVVQAVYGAWFYVFQSVSPRQLSPLYSKPPDLAGMIFSFLLTGFFAALLFVFRKKKRTVGMVAAASVLLIVPMLGITQSGSQLFADRFTYLAAVPFSVLIVLFLVRMYYFRRLIFVSGSVLLVLFGIQSTTWCCSWQESLSLWECALAADQDNPVAYNNAGLALKQHGQYERALDYFNSAVRLNPGYVQAWHNRSVVLAILGDRGAAFRGWKIALSLPSVSTCDRLKILWVRGWVYEQNNQLDKALEDYSTVIKEKRVSADERAGWLLLRAKLYRREGLFERARSDVKRVLTLSDLSGARHQEVHDLLKSISESESIQKKPAE